jgi:hypothetical protein
MIDPLSVLILGEATLELALLMATPILGSIPIFASGIP